MKKLLIPVFLLVPFTGAHAATFILSSDTFGTGQNILNAGNANVALTTTAGDPTSSGHGNVGSADIAPGGRWGEVRAQVNSLAIPVESTPGTDTFSMSLDVYIPSATTFAATDRVGVILRWNGSNTNNNQVFRTWDSFTPDTWETVTLTGTLPVNGGDGQPLTSVVPIISFDDNPADAAPGVAAHIDNWSLSVTGVPEPSTGILGVLSAALFLCRRRR